MIEENDVQPLLVEASTKQLFDELSRRFDVVAVAVIEQEGTEAEAITLHYTGSRFAVIGLLESFSTDLEGEVIDLLDEDMEGEEWKDTTDE